MMSRFVITAKRTTFVPKFVLLITAGVFIGIGYYLSPLLLIGLLFVILIVLSGLFFPTYTAWIALLSVAISPQYLITQNLMGLEISSLHKLVIILAIIPFVLKFGFRDKKNIIIIAYIFSLILTYTVSSTPPELGITQPIKSFIGLTLGWIIFSLNWIKVNHRKFILSIALLPIISVGTGVVLHLLGIKPLYGIEYTGAFRLLGANIGAHLAMLAVVGIMASMGEALREGNKKFYLWIAIINFAILVATGTRGATLAALFLFLPYILSQFKRLILGRMAKHLFAVSIIAVAIVLIAFPNFITRITGSTFEQGINTSGRLAAWEFFIHQANENPWFGRGLGAGTMLNQGQVHSAFRVPHNEFIRMYVDGGIVGTMILLTAFLSVFLRIKRSLSGPIYNYLTMIILAFITYSIFDNTLSTTQFSVPFGWYLGLIYAREKLDRTLNKITYQSDEPS
jgi:teichuronic acid biosynthesis protein TuaE